MWGKDWVSRRNTAMMMSLRSSPRRNMACTFDLFLLATFGFAAQVKWRVQSDSSSEDEPQVFPKAQHGVHLQPVPCCYTWLCSTSHVEGAAATAAVMMSLSFPLRLVARRERRGAWMEANPARPLTQQRGVRMERGQTHLMTPSSMTGLGKWCVLDFGSGHLPLCFTVLCVVDSFGEPFLL